MVQATLDQLWVPKEILPATMKIVSVVLKKGTSKGKEYEYAVLGLLHQGQQYVYDAKFGDKNYLINKFGVDTEDWIGEDVGIRMDDDGKWKQLY